MVDQWSPFIYLRTIECPQLHLSHKNPWYQQVEEENKYLNSLNDFTHHSCVEMFAPEGQWAGELALAFHSFSLSSQQASRNMGIPAEGLRLKMHFSPRNWPKPRLLISLNATKLSLNIG